MPLLDTARKLGLARGVLGDSRPWLVVAGVAWGIRALQWARRPAPATVLREVLEPGQTLVIRHDPAPPTRRQRRRATRRDRRSARKALKRAKRTDAAATAATVEAVTGQSGVTG
jgi:hypothetical protein